MEGTNCIGRTICNGCVMGAGLLWVPLRTTTTEAEGSRSRNCTPHGISHPAGTRYRRSSFPFLNRSPSSLSSDLTLSRSSSNTFSVNIMFSFGLGDSRTQVPREPLVVPLKTASTASYPSTPKVLLCLSDQPPILAYPPYSCRLFPFTGL